mmetsp:Transcript_104504/g.300404  ORF Transcript_104504/g.300404 Transcript_104504/m.300404 type:complete len:232 (-) Transcript_104504:720-1415(-)
MASQAQARTRTPSLSVNHAAPTAQPPSQRPLFQSARGASASSLPPSRPGPARRPPTGSPHLLRPRAPPLAGPRRRHRVPRSPSRTCRSLPGRVLALSPHTKPPPLYSCSHPKPRCNGSRCSCAPCAPRLLPDHCSMPPRARRRPGSNRSSRSRNRFRGTGCNRPTPCHQWSKKPSVLNRPPCRSMMWSPVQGTECLGLLARSWTRCSPRPCCSCPRASSRRRSRDPRPESC